MSRWPSSTNGWARVIQPSRRVSLSDAPLRICVTYAQSCRCRSAGCASIPASTPVIARFTAASNSGPGVTCSTSPASHAGGPSPS